MDYNPSNLILIAAFLGLIPLLVVLTTSFIKISMVLILARESLGVQQAPPNVLVYALSLVLSVYIMGGVFNKTYLAITADLQNPKLNPASLMSDIAMATNPLRDFLIKHSDDNEKSFFMSELKRFWPANEAMTVKKTDFLIIVPSFVVHEISQAFKIGFALYLPSLIIDIIISNILMALGMMMMSPVTISLPIKLLLFISIDGWNRIIHLLFNTY